MLEPRIQQQFIDSADLNYKLAPTLSGAVDAAVQALLACVTGGHTLLVGATGRSAMLAQYFADAFVGPFERERPELRALALTTRSGPSGTTDLARQVRALGAPGDVLLLISTTGQGPLLQEAASAAHAREMTVIALTGADGGELRRRLNETDVLLCVPHERAARIREVHLLVLNCLCDGVDSHLLGEQENLT